MLPPDAGKTAWRRWALDRRRSRTDDEIAAARFAISGHLLAVLGGRAGTVCAYLPLRTEPLAPRLPSNLTDAGVQVLVPVTRPERPLAWAAYSPGVDHPVGTTGVPEPADPVTVGDSMLATVSAVLVPALLVDEAGVRLGRGGGHYDRSFAATPLGRVPLRIAVLFDDERVPRLPAEPFDVAVSAVVTPSGGVEHIGADLR